MYSKTSLSLKWFQYYLAAASGGGHGIHSPFVFDFIVRVLNDRKKYPEFDRIERLRKELMLDKTILEIEDLGAGSLTSTGSNRSVKAIVKSAARTKKWGKFLFRLAHHYQPKNMLELGTSLGISTAYLASGNPEGKLITMEGAASVASLAKQNFQRLGLKNIELIGGHFDNTLPELIVSLRTNQVQKFDVVFVDGNHRKTSTLGYFEMLLPEMADSSIIVFDDVHWSADMEDAWKCICNDQRVLLSVDLFFMGIVFLRKEFKVKQHFTIRY